MFNAIKLQQLPRFLCLLTGTILFIDGAVLMAKKNVSFGVTFPFCIAILLLGISWQWQALHNWLGQKKRRKQCWYLCWTGVGIWLLSVAAFFYFIHATHDTNINTIQGSIKTIIVLGSNARDCEAPATLAARIQLGATWAQRLPTSKIIVSGGLDQGERCTEAQVMGNFLRAQGISAARILQEERSTNTFENIAFSKQIMAKNGIAPDDGLLIVTSDFHSVRSALIAHKAGFINIANAGASTPLSVRYNHWLREYFSFIRGWVVADY